MIPPSAKKLAEAFHSHVGEHTNKHDSSNLLCSGSRNEGHS